MAESEGGCKGKTAGMLATFVTLVTLASTVGKQVWDARVAQEQTDAAKRKAEEEARKAREAKEKAEGETRRLAFLRVSHLGVAMGDAHVELLRPKESPGAPDFQAVKATMDELGLGARFRSPKGDAEFQAFDKDLNQAVRDAYRKSAWFVYQAMELSEEVLAALTVGQNGDPKVRARWLADWAARQWPWRAGILKADAKLLNLGVEVPNALDPAATQATAERLGALQDAVKNAIEAGKIPE